jgi:hypothetical protein
MRNHLCLLALSTALLAAPALADPDVSGKAALTWWDRPMCVTFAQCEETFRVSLDAELRVQLPFDLQIVPFARDFMLTTSTQENGHARPLGAWLGVEAAWQPFESWRFIVGGASEHWFDGRVNTVDSGLPNRNGNYIRIEWAPAN